MTNGREFDKPAIYQIRVSGNLEQKWSDWFDGLAIIPQPGHETLLVGTVADQATLHGMLTKISNLGLPLLLVKRAEKVERGPSGDASDGRSLSPIH